MSIETLKNSAATIPQIRTIRRKARARYWAPPVVVSRCSAAMAIGLFASQGDEIAGLVIQRQETRMQLLESGFRIEIFEQFRMQPFGNLLDRHELIRVVVELVPDGVDIAVLDR